MFLVMKMRAIKGNLLSRIGYASIAGELDRTHERRFSNWRTIGTNASVATQWEKKDPQGCNWGKR